MCDASIFTHKTSLVTCHLWSAVNHRHIQIRRHIKFVNHEVVILNGIMFWQLKDRKMWIYSCEEKICLFIVTHCILSNELIVARIVFVWVKTRWMELNVIIKQYTKWSTNFFHLMKEYKKTLKKKNLKTFSKMTEFAWKYQRFEHVLFISVLSEMTLTLRINE